MPVGCLGDVASACGTGSVGGANGLNGEMEVVMTSSVLNSAEQFAFMQQTMLMQIFRQGNAHAQDGAAPTAAHSNGRTSAQSAASNGSSGSGSSQGTSCCPTCSPFSEQCCQNESGVEIFQEFVEINLQCYWDAKLSDALGTLRYQGYVCPGILVLLSHSPSSLEVVADAWRRRLLVPPPNCRLCQVGLSSGCVVKPMLQTHCIALTDIICLILARLKQRQQVADTDTVCACVESDWSGAHRAPQQANATNADGTPATLRDQVHQALGQLIKLRRVYYTGNKGYFLVGPSDAGTNVVSPVLRNLAGGLGHRLNKMRHSLRADSHANRTGRKVVDQECQTGGGSPEPASPTSAAAVERLKTPGDANDSIGGSSNNSHNSSSNSGSSGGNSFNLERSQSLRISKKSLRNTSKGGSLKLSKKDAMVFNEEDEDDGDDSNAVASALNRSAGDASSAGVATPNKSGNFERKNSFLGKLFSSSKRKTSNGGSAVPAATPGQNGAVGGRPKPKLGSFSAQFPPPELVEHYTCIYAAVVKKPATPPSAALPAVARDDDAVSPTAQVRNGPSGNYVVYERSNGNAGNVIYGTAGHDASYAASSSSTPPRPRVPLPHGPPITSTPSVPAVAPVYSAPPPPLPYRPPPPNPYVHNPPPIQPQQRPQPQSPYVRRGDILPTLALSDPSSSSSSSSSSNNSSEPSSIDSQVGGTQTRTAAPGPRSQDVQRPTRHQQQQPTRKLLPPSPLAAAQHQKNAGKVLFDDSLLSIERSNQELEMKLNKSNNNNNNINEEKSKTLPSSMASSRVQMRYSPSARTSSSAVDTIHNHRNTLSQEIIYEVEEHNGSMSRASSQSTIKNNEQEASSSSQEPSFPSVTDLTGIADELLGSAGQHAFKSLTAQKLMAGLNFSSVDTLLEVNAVAEVRDRQQQEEGGSHSSNGANIIDNNNSNNMNQSTETVDFGVI